MTILVLSVRFAAFCGTSLRDLAVILHSKLVSLEDVNLFIQIYSILQDNDIHLCVDE